MRHVLPHVTAWSALLLLGGTVHPATPPDTRFGPQAGDLHRRPSSITDGGIVARWNELAYEIGFSEDSFLTFKAQHAFVVMHLAMHDAINAVAPRYRQHTFRGQDRQADAAMAAAQAAHDVLGAFYPGASARLRSELSSTMARSPDEERRSRGMSVGRQSADAHLTARVGDGWDSKGSYSFSSSPGSYRTTPPWNGFVLQPGFRAARTFGIPSPDHFRPGPPPALESSAYATALDEVRRLGRRNSSQRTDERTAFATWWMEFSEGSVNRLARRLVVERQASLHDAARLFSLLNLSLYDTYIAVWDTKYHFNHWRPVTAIHEAGGDGNSRTEADTGWEPLLPAPPFPEYVSAHAAGCAAAFGVLSRVFGDIGTFDFSTITAPKDAPPRQFASFDQAAAECADSRIMLGWHFRYSTDAGLELGRTVSAYLAAHYLGA